MCQNSHTLIIFIWKVNNILKQHRGKDALNDVLKNVTLYNHKNIVPLISLFSWRFPLRYAKFIFSCQMIVFFYFDTYFQM